MANASETTGELYKANVLTEADIAAAVDAFIADAATTAFLFGDGYRIDRVVAVGPDGWSFVTVADEKATDHLTRAAVRTAILLARPEEV